MYLIVPHLKTFSVTCHVSLVTVWAEHHLLLSNGIVLMALLEMSCHVVIRAVVEAVWTRGLRSTMSSSHMLLQPGGRIGARERAPPPDAHVPAT